MRICNIVCILKNNIQKIGRKKRFRQAQKAPFKNKKLPFPKVLVLGKEEKHKTAEFLRQMERKTLFKNLPTAEDYCLRYRRSVGFFARKAIRA